MEPVINKKIMSLKRLTILILLQGIIYVGNSQSAGRWFAHGGGLLADHGRAIAVDAAGSTYVTGSFQALSDFETWRLSSEGDTDIFLAKYDSLGQLAWLRRAGSNSISVKTLTESGIDVLVTGNAVYITGMFSGIAKFETTELRSFGRDDIFLAKYSLEGELEWVKNAGGVSQDIPYSLSNDQSGNIYVTGSFQKTATFAEHAISSSHGGSAMFLCKYNTQGQVQWVKMASTPNAKNGKVVLCNARYCVIAGVNQSESGEEGSFLEKYDLDGTLQYSTVFDGESRITIEDIKLLQNDLFVTGTFYGSVNVNGNLMFSHGESDLYVGKLNDHGEFTWINTLGGSKMDTGGKLAISKNGQILLTGNFQDYMEFEGGSMSSRGDDDIFLLSLSPRGTINWFDYFGGEGQDRTFDAEIFEESIFVTGYFRSVVRVNERLFESKGLSDFFLNKLPLKPAAVVPEEEPFHFVTIYPNPSVEDIIIDSKEIIRSIRIHNLLGQCVYEGDLFDTRKVKISVKALGAGTYVVTVNTGNKIHESKLIRP